MANEYKIHLETFESLSDFWIDSGSKLSWECFFTLPPWLKVWWQTFGKEWNPHLTTVKRDGHIVGIAPLMVQGKTAALMGNRDVCDYLDFIVTPKREKEVLKAVLKHLREEGITSLDLGPLRSDSFLFKSIPYITEELGFDVSTELEDVSVEMDLPASWDDYLSLLKGKQRHEVRRKLRRLYEAPRVTTRISEDSKEMDTFFELFRLNRSDKADFMTDQMSSFFRSLAETLAELKILKLLFLEIDSHPAAAAMCFDYNSTLYLYNNGYDHQYSSLSVGLMVKVLSIKRSIEQGMVKFDFLKGEETYKYRLGGKAVSIYRCKLALA